MFVSRFEAVMFLVNDGIKKFLEHLMNKKYDNRLNINSENVHYELQTIIESW